MKFSEVLGQEHLKNHLMKSTDNGRISHAQLFVGKEGAGTLPMAIAYAQYILCRGSPIFEVRLNNILSFSNDTGIEFDSFVCNQAIH